MKILRTASLGSNFTGSYKKKESIARQDHYSPRWKLHVDELSIFERNVPCTENKGQSRETASEIAEQI